MEISFYFSNENFVKSIFNFYIITKMKLLLKKISWNQIPAVLGEGQRGDGLAGSIDDMTLFIFAGVI